jgi:hypothetical protein
MLFVVPLGPFQKHPINQAAVFRLGFHLLGI